MQYHRTYVFAHHSSILHLLIPLLHLYTLRNHASALPPNPHTCSRSLHWRSSTPRQRLPLSITPGEAIEYAKANGIDLAGTIPDDYTSYDDEEEGRYNFEGGSRASALWARAQVAAVELNIPSFAKRANSTSGVGISIYVSTTPLYSVHGVCRGGCWSQGRQLGFSKLNAGGDYCGTYAYTASRTTPPGCWNSDALNCDRLWLNYQVI
ncbi:hypothetical protein DFH27DRAFT_523957 [Peziza echinospora]|nr:hypothetical protein DFH27DRAFT_523957 [Peziza echinospora]